VTVELRVEDRLRRPIVGLDAGNFLISEEGRAVGEQNFLGASFSTPRADISILMERSPQTAALGDELAAAVRDISAALAAGGISLRSLVSAGEQPQRENISPSSQPNGPGLARVLEAAARGGTYSPRWRFDLALRLAATDLLPGEKKRSVVFVSSGGLGELAFEQYSLSQLAAYLANNGIVFNAVIVGGGPAGEDLRYLCGETGGQALALYRSEGIGPLIRGILSQPSGSYTLSYRSALPTDFGRAYLPVEAQVYLMDRSGRDGSGYFVPLE
jgi:hypothetical protein